SWHTDDRTGDPVPGKTGTEAAFDERGRRLAGAEQIRSAIDLVAVRVTATSRATHAVLLLNVTDRDVGLAGWSLATARDNIQSLAGAIVAGQPLAIDVPKAFFDADGGGCNTSRCVRTEGRRRNIPPASDAQPGWNKVS